jgi:type II secretion system protein G
MKDKGFTLVELLVVMAILGVLVTLIAGGFRTAQMRGRDAKKKSDLKEIANSLEIYFNDHSEYPSSSGGQLMGCPATTGSCAWGSGEFTDGETVYFKAMPKDPSPSMYYYYRAFSNDQKFQIYAHLENPRDKNCLGGDCEAPPALPGGVLCGSLCNYSVTSPNTEPTEN